MRLKVNELNEITDYALIGDVDGSIEFTGALPGDFEADYKSCYYLLQDNEIVVNPDYQEPTVDIPETPEPSGPSPEMLAINALGIQLAKHLAGGD